MPAQNLTRLTEEVESSEGLEPRARWVLFLLGRDRSLRHGVPTPDANPSSRRSLNQRRPLPCSVWVRSPPVDV